MCYVLQIRKANKFLCAALNKTALCRVLRLKQGTAWLLQHQLSSLQCHSHHWCLSRSHWCIPRICRKPRRFFFHWQVATQSSSPAPMTWKSELASCCALATAHDKNARLVFWRACHANLPICLCTLFHLNTHCSCLLLEMYQMHLERCWCSWNRWALIAHALELWQVMTWFHLTK